MTTISEQGTIQTRVQEAEGAAGGNLDKVRDLLFGGQMRDYDRKFARLEERLVKETSELRDDVKKRLAALEGYMKAEIESLSDRLRAEQDARGGAAKDLAGSCTRRRSSSGRRPRSSTTSLRGARETSESSCTVSSRSSVTTSASG